MRSTKDNRGKWDEWFESDEREQPEIVIDCEGQALWVRVGFTYSHEKEDKEPGIWIDYQKKYLDADMFGPILISKETWRELNASIEEALGRRG